MVCVVFNILLSFICYIRYYFFFFLLSFPLFLYVFVHLITKYVYYYCSSLKFFHSTVLSFPSKIRNQNIYYNYFLLFYKGNNKVSLQNIKLKSSIIIFHLSTSPKKPRPKIETRQGRLDTSR